VAAPAKLHNAEQWLRPAIPREEEDRVGGFHGRCLH
jgi:hypothetical protein